ncbi:MAG TPA: hypothetical protein VFE51_27180 [Verrucomicrobiae bacterium]|nr:hypothetical protein [Verrucomicrobiae bacterium]
MDRSSDFSYEEPIASLSYGFDEALLEMRDGVQVTGRTRSLRDMPDLPL